MTLSLGLSGFSGGRPGFDLWVGKIPWRRKWQPTPVLLPGKSHGQRSLVGYGPWGHKESDTTKRLHFWACLVFFHDSIEFMRFWQDITEVTEVRGFPGGRTSKEPACRCRRYKRCRFDLWIGKIPWSRAWKPTLVFLPGECHGPRSLVGYSP